MAALATGWPLLRRDYCTINEGDPYVAVSWTRTSKVCVCVCVCVCSCVGYCHFYQVSRISPYGHSGVLGSGHSHRSTPTVRAQGASLCYPSTSVICTLDQNLARCPGTTLEVRVVAPWLPPGQLHGNSSTSPSWPCCPVCCVCDGAITAGGARGSEAASMPTHSATFSERVPLTHGFRRPPPGTPTPGIEPMTSRV